jgi:hypothetical protein
LPEASDVSDRKTATMKNLVALYEWYKVNRPSIAARGLDSYLERSPSNEQPSAFVDVFGRVVAGRITATANEIIVEWVDNGTKKLLFWQNFEGSQIPAGAEPVLAAFLEKMLESP